jgi:L-ascorbate metabolism protein UlaG (beta-lactamase superfamily)
LGHSAFRLRGKEVTIVTDPYPPTLGPSMGKVSADIVTVSHASPNHSFVSGVGGDPRVVEGPGEYEIADVLIAGVATALEPGNGPSNTAVCHLGDLRKRLTDQQVEEIGSIDVLLVPVGGSGALGPTEAAEVVSQLDPSVVIPMHFRLEQAPGGAGTRPDLLPVEHFCREMGSKDVTPETKLTLTKSTLPSEIRLVVLENRRA